MHLQMEEIWNAKYVEIAWSLHPVWAHDPPQISPSQKLSEHCPSGFYGDFITKAQLIKSLTNNDWVNLPSPLPSGHGVGLTHVQSHDLFWQPAHVLRWPWGIPKLYLINITKDTFIFLTTWEIPRVLGALS